MARSLFDSPGDYCSEARPQSTKHSFGANPQVHQLAPATSRPTQLIVHGLQFVPPQVLPAHPSTMPMLQAWN